MKRNALSKPERLNSERRIEALFQGGRKGAVGPLRFVWTVAPAPAAVPTPATATTASAPVSVLFSAPKKNFKKAWKRNLLKRRMRESYRQRKHDLIAAAISSGHCIDLAIVCTPEGPKGAAQLPDFATIDNAIARILEKIAARHRA